MTIKDAMLKKAEARLKQADAEIDRMTARAEEAEADSKIRLNRELAELKDQQRAFQNRASELESARDDALEDLREGFERAWSTLSNSLERAASHF